MLWQLVPTFQKIFYLKVPTYKIALNQKLIHLSPANIKESGTKDFFQIHYQRPHLKL